MPLLFKKILFLYWILITFNFEFLFLCFFKICIASSVNGISVSYTHLYQTGFLFSFTAMLAIVQYSRLFPEQEDEKRTDHEGNRKSINAWIKNSLRNRLTDLKKNLRFSLWLQLWLLPMTAWFYYEVPLYAMFLNLLILPFSSWLLGGGLIAALIYVCLLYTSRCV